MIHRSSGDERRGCRCCATLRLPSCVVVVVVVLLVEVLKLWELE